MRKGIAPNDFKVVKDLNEPSRLFKAGSVSSTPHCYRLTVFCLGLLENTTGD